MSRSELVTATASGRTGLYPRCECGPDYEAPSPGRRRSGSREGLGINLAGRGIQVIEAYPASPGGLVRQVRRQRRAILKVREIIDVDQCGDRLAVLADGDGTVALPRLGDELIKVRLSGSRRNS